MITRLLLGRSSNHGRAMNAKLTKSEIDSAEPREKDYFIWDTKLTGFGLKVTPAGSKIFLVQYRIDRTRRVTIGAYKTKNPRVKTFTPDQARRKAEQLLGQVANDIDPAETKTLERKKGKFGDHLRHYFENEVKPLKKPTTVDSYERVIRLYVPARLKGRKTANITKQDIRTIRDGMKDNPYGANKTLAVLSAFFNWCEGDDIRPNNSNPCKGIKKYKEKSHDRFLRPDEQIRLAKALSDSSNSKFHNPYAIAAIRLLAFTGARKSEILTLRWEWVDFENKTLNLPDSKTGAKQIYLNAPALEVLSRISRIDDNPFVIVGSKPGQHLVNLQKPWKRIREAADLPDLRLHDLRHTFASIAVMGGMSLPMVGALLGHKHSRTTQRYAHLSGDPLLQASERVARTMVSQTNLDALAEVKNG